ncbi:MAG: FKBP-type peptidyl-prolyl cis-trans isomerase [Cyclobacteriaceae bacterium]
MKKTGNYLMIFTVWVICQSCLDTDLNIPTFDPVAQFVFDTTLIESYLDENGIVAEKDPDGIRYVIHEPGMGESPKTSDTITVSYTGWILGEEEHFDKGENVEFPLRFTIIGWQIGMQYLKEGGSIDLYIPSGQAYANRGNGNIPPNVVLKFEVDLHKVGASD